MEAQHIGMCLGGARMVEPTRPKEEALVALSGKWINSATITC